MAQAQASGDSAAAMNMPASAAPSSVTTLTPTPTSAAFSFGETAQQYHSSLVAAIAGSGAVQDAGSIKTQRSASLPYIRSATGKPAHGSSLSKTFAGEGAQSTSDGNLVGLGISNTPPPGAAQPLRHRTSCNHLRRAAPYTVAQPLSSPRVNSPQISPMAPWYANGIRRASRDVLLGQGMPPAAFARRESDVELAMAMNSAFTNGDMLGTHRSLGDIYSAAAVPPSPLSNIAISATSAPMQAASGASSDMGYSATTSASKEPTTSTDATVPPPNDTYGPASTGAQSVSTMDSSGMLSADMMLAIFNAMAATPDSNNLPALSTAPQPSGAAVNPAALAFDPNALMSIQGQEEFSTKDTSDLWATWTQAAGNAQNLMPTDPLAQDNGSNSMHVDWPSNDASTQR
ncbi:hypothetical protein H4R22_004993 [Coemansia sp. RSA 1290]|nr:hypothetical protein H4R22_004993 [Coemansia sp. RSA 1290]